jgi:cell division protein FtsZ
MTDARPSARARLIQRQMKNQQDMIYFDLPKQQSSIIKVIGVGGGGTNAVNYMFNQGIEGVDFVICNTDQQSLASSKVPNRIQLGPNLTQGLGAGANPSIGRQATEESLEEIRRILEVNTKMVFITAGMGGGTGTGGAPIVAKMCREMGILTVGIVTTPFSYEGRKRQMQAQEGIEEMKAYVDTLLIISNDKLRHQYGNLTMRAAFSTADNVLATAAKCITDVISSKGHINVDFADVCTVMRNGGVAILGNARAEGEDRARLAIEQAVNSPLLNDNDIRGAKWMLININSAEGEFEFKMDEVEVIQQYLMAHAGSERDLILGMGYDNSLGKDISITLIATGFEHRSPFEAPVAKPATAHVEPSQATPEKPVVFSLDEAPKASSVKKAMEATPAPVVEMPTLFELGSDEKSTPPVLNEPRSAEKQDIRPEQGIFPFQTTVVPSPLDSTAPQRNPNTEDRPQRSSEDIQPSHEFKSEPSSSTAKNSGFLARPSRIYADEDDFQHTVNPDPVNLNVKQAAVEGSDPDAEIRLVFSENPAADDVISPGKYSHSAFAEEPALQDEAEELKRKAAERLHKLRNLSFNANAADPNNEFEHVPAFIRRNLLEKELTHSVAEEYYSSITVKPDERNKGHLSSLNSFLEGKKPD